ncbi:glycosyltransferase family 2 protein [Rhizobium paknamense]|uniref:GT2 family glycosyltransferase n=1 Tax=Rhizobium paknamense TaxID=1206817 RepID=A0ABU0IL95_9HYPH|nr:glycosyltransferase family A protein [Rhizobium paknamense]MDQ0458165.1 GT2 family glycosyltransferase [Rhizobium paknamense]
MFSLIVCSVDRSDALARLFRSLASQTLRDFEVVLVDQNADDRLAPLVAQHAADFPIRHVRSPRGLSRARNAGIAVAERPLIAFPDDDCWYRHETLANAKALFSTDDSLDIVTGRTLDAQGQPSVSPSGDRRTTITRQNYLACGNSNGIFVKAALLARIGGFDEKLGVGAQTPFQSGEEADLLLRAIESGARLAYVPDLIVHHDQVVATDNPRRIERAAKYGAGFGALLRKHGFPGTHIAYRLLRPLAGAALALARRDLGEVRYKIAWARGIWRGYRDWPKR